MFDVERLPGVAVGAVVDRGGAGASDDDQPLFEVGRSVLRGVSGHGPRRPHEVRLGLPAAFTEVRVVTPTLQPLHDVRTGLVGEHRPLRAVRHRAGREHPDPLRSCVHVVGRSGGGEVGRGYVAVVAVRRPATPPRIGHDLLRAVAVSRDVQPWCPLPAVPFATTTPMPAIAATEMATPPAVAARRVDRRRRPSCTAVAYRSGIGAACSAASWRLVRTRSSTFMSGSFR